MIDAADASPTPAVLVRDLRFAWPRQAPLLDIAALDVAAGERLLLSGPSGSGKSTLLGLVTGILSGASGECRVLGENMVTLSPEARDRLRADRLGYIFQSFNLVPYLSVLDNVLLPCRLSARRAAAAGQPREAARALLASLGLEAARFRSKVTDLSVGQQQRVAAARALIGAPDLIIADEPTSALDEPRKHAFLDLLLAEAGKAGAAVLFVSHDPTLADRFDREIRLADINAAFAGEPA